MNYNRIVIALCFIMLGSQLYAQPHRMERRMENEKDRIMDRLSLTDQQKDQFDNVRIATQKKNIEIRSKIATLRLDVQKEIKGTKIDRSALEKKLSEMGDLEVQMRKNRLSAWFECNSFLQPEQQKVWKETLQRHTEGMERMGKMKGKGKMERKMPRHQCPMQNEL